MPTEIVDDPNDESDMPVADQFASGYFSNLHSNRGRYFYVDIRKSF